MTQMTIVHCAGNVIFVVAKSMGMTVYSSKPELPAIDVELLGKPIHAVRDNLTTLIETACLSLSNALQSWLNTHQVNVTLDDVALHTFYATQTDAEQMSALRHQDQGMVFLHIEPAMLVALSDRFYRAAIARQEPNLTSSDLRLQERIAARAANWIAPQEMWQPCAFEQASGMGLRASFTVEVAECRGRMTLDLESQLIETLIRQLDLAPAEQGSQRFLDRLHTTPVQLNVLLSRKRLPLSDVLALTPNDILPIELLGNCPVSIGNQTLFHGRVAEQDGQLVVILNHD